MPISLSKAALVAVATGALAAAAAAPAGADGLTGPGTAICGPSNGSFHAAGGPGYAQYGPPPVPQSIFDKFCGPPV